MTKKNDLGAYKGTGGDKNVLKAAIEKTEESNPAPVKAVRKKATGGRKVPIKRTYRVQLMLTEEEGKNLEAKAGRVPLSTYVRDELGKADIL